MADNDRARGFVDYATARRDYLRRTAYLMCGKPVGLSTHNWKGNTEVSDRDSLAHQLATRWSRSSGELEEWGLVSRS